MMIKDIPQDAIDQIAAKKAARIAEQEDNDERSNASVAEVTADLVDRGFAGAAIEGTLPGFNPGGHFSSGTVLVPAENLGPQHLKQAVGMGTVEAIDSTHFISPVPKQ